MGGRAHPPQKRGLPLCNGLRLALRTALHLA